MNNVRISIKNTGKTNVRKHYSLMSRFNTIDKIIQPYFKFVQFPVQLIKFLFGNQLSIKRLSKYGNSF